MAQASASIDIPVSPDRVWGLLVALPAGLAAIHSQKRIDGRWPCAAGLQSQRRYHRRAACDFRRSGAQLQLRDPTGAVPVTDYFSTLRVEETDRGKGSRVEWFGRFTPKGVSEHEASRLFQGIYEDGLKALAEGLVATRK